MGREARTYAEVGAESGEVHVLLESTELILGGAIKRRYARTSITNVTADREVLRLDADGESVALHLGAKSAAAWVAAILTPPPSLQAKLGLDKGARAFLVGKITDDALLDATRGALVGDGSQAQMMIALIYSPESLTEAQHAHALFPELPLWAVYPKGRSVGLGDSVIRAALRAADFRDTKSCAVSDALTATRYQR